jgi:hypothetical protein
MKTENEIKEYRCALFLQTLLDNDCIKGVGTIQTAKELLRESIRKEAINYGRQTKKD